MKYYVSTAARCPFYKQESPQRIYCVGVDSNTSTNLSFAGKTEKEGYRHRYCEKAYEGCLIFMARKGKYRGTAKSKYRNVPVVTGNGRFDSKKEEKRYRELLLLQQAGEISELQRQVKFLLIPKQEGERECAYCADFTYMENGKLVVEDCKGWRTDVYRIKRKLMLERHGVKIRET